MMAIITVQILDNAKESKLGTIFRSLDTDFDGKIEKNDLWSVFANLGRVDEETLNQIMHNCDFDNNGKISYTEFLTISIDWKKELCYENLEKVLNYFDILKKGALTRSDLKTYFPKAKKEEWEAFFQECDSNKDKLISVFELKQYFSRNTESLSK